MRRLAGVSATAGAIFHGTRIPLTVWFAAAWHMASDKQGVSALGLKRVLEIGSTQTARAMLHRYRSAMVRPGRDRLSGTVEADETFLGVPEPGVRGRGALGKLLVEVAAERRGRSLGCCRPQVIDDAHAARLRAFLLAHVELRSVVLTRRLLPGYPSACSTDYVHRPTSISGFGQQAHELLSGVHRAGHPCQALVGGQPARSRETRLAPAISRRVLLRLQARHSRARGMLFYRLLEQAVQSAPRTHRSLVAIPGGCRRRMPVPPPDKRAHCDSLAGPVLDPSWLDTSM